MILPTKISTKIAQSLFLSFIIGTIIFVSAAAIKAQNYPVKAVGDRHTLILLSDGSVIGFGPCDWGELGPISDVPQRRNWATDFVSVKLPRKAVDIAAGEASSFALLKNGTVYAWGEKFKAKFGDGKTPVQIPGLQNITKISVAYRHFLALDKSNHVWVWGENYCGKTGRTDDPKMVAQVPELADVVSIAAGACVSTVVKKDGTVWVWGSNGMAGFGNGQQTEGADLQFVPQQVSVVRNAVAVSSGAMGRHTLVLLKDGSLRGWGNSDWGQIGAGVSGDFQPRPVTPKITNVKAIFAVQNSSYALKNDNTFWIWGSVFNEFPLKKNASVPVQLSLK